MPTVLRRNGRHACGFQTLQVRVQSLSVSTCWAFHLPDFHVRASLRYVYHSSQWMVAGNTDHSCISPRLYVHPDSPCTGETWMRQVISFDRVKLTNNEMDDKGHVGNPRVLKAPPAAQLGLFSGNWREMDAAYSIPPAHCNVLIYNRAH